MSRELICTKTGRSSYEDDSIVEMHFACGHSETLCFDARKRWLEFISHHPIQKKLEILNTRMWAARALLKRGVDKTDLLITLIEESQQLEKEMFDIGSNWLAEKDEE